AAWPPSMRRPDPENRLFLAPLSNAIMQTAPRSWLSRLWPEVARTGRYAGRARPARFHHRRLSLEQLEDRTLPAPSCFSSTDVPLRVPATGTSGAITSTLTVPNPLIIGDLNVQLDLDHTFDSDLDVFLRSPAGTRIALFEGVGDDGQNFRGTILDDEADTLITEGSAPFSDRFRPQDRLAAFDGQDAQGTWSLDIVDNSTA